MGERGLHHIACAQHVVRDSFDDIHLHERNVFMRRRMEDHLGLMLLKYLRKTVRSAHIRNDGRKEKIRVNVVKLEINFKDAILAMTQQDQFGWVATGDLAAKLTPDGAPCARNQNPFSGKCGTDGFVIDAHRLAAQEVVNVHFAQTVDTHPATNEFVYAGNGARGNAFYSAYIVNHAHERARR